LNQIERSLKKTDLISDCITEQAFYYKINNKNNMNIFFMKIESDAKFIEEHPLIFNYIKTYSASNNPSTIRDSFVINFQDSNYVEPDHHMYLMYTVDSITLYLKNINNTTDLDIQQIIIDD